MTHSGLEHQEGDWEVLPVTDPQILPTTNYPPLRSNSFLHILIANGEDSVSQHIFEERLLEVAAKIANKCVLNSLIDPCLSPTRNGPIDTNTYSKICEQRDV